MGTPPCPESSPQIPSGMGHCDPRFGTSAPITAPSSYFSTASSNINDGEALQARSGASPNAAMRLQEQQFVLSTAGM